MALLQFLRKLDKEWKKFARFIGFSDDEIRILSGVSTSHEWKNFSKVWRMPDLGYRTEAVLEETSVAANIVLGKLHIVPIKYIKLYVIYIAMLYVSYSS